MSAQSRQFKSDRTNAGRSGPQRAIWERAMRRLRVSVRLLGVVLLALGARMVITGVTVLSALTAAIIAGLLFASMHLAHQGRRLEPRQDADREPG